MSLKNKALKADAFKQGKISFNFKNLSIQTGPHAFSNSSELTKIQNRNRKNRNK